MPAWIYVVAVAAVLTVAWYGWARRWLHAWRYSWARAAHAVDVTIGELVPGAEYGSMILDAERGWGLPLPVMLAAPVDPEPWRAGEHTEAMGYTRMDWRRRIEGELSPEALDLPSEGGPWRAPEGFPMGQVVTVQHGGTGFEITEHFPEPPGGWDSITFGDGEHYPPIDPGAGDAVSSDPPAPDWLAAQMAATFNWSREARVRLAAI